MKNIILIPFLIFISFHMSGQKDGIEKIKHDIDREIRKAEDSSDILTRKGMNLFFAKRVATYLTGSQELSLYKNYSSLSTENDRFSLGHNISFPSNDTDRVKHVITFAFEANVKEKFATIFESKDWSKEMGISLKYTHIYGGNINYFVGDKEKVQIQKLYDPKAAETSKENQYQYMKNKRKVIRSQIGAELDKECKELSEGIKEINDQALTDQVKKEKLKELSKKYKKEFATKEDEAIEDQEDFKTYNTSFVWWWSLGGFIPVSDKAYTVADSFSVNSHKKYLYPIEGFLKFNFLKEFRSTRWFYNISYKGYNNNSAKAALIKEYDFGTYKNLTSSGDTAKASTLESNKVFVGKMETFFTSQVKAQIVIFHTKWDYIGLDLFCEQYFGKYNPLNAGIGLPVNLKGKDDETKVNFELVFKATDLSNTMEPTKTFADKFTIGFSIALPFGSIIY